MTISTNQNQMVDHNAEMSLIDIVAQFYQNKWLFLLITLLTLAMGVFYSSRQAVQYSSDILLQIESKQQTLGRSDAASQMLFGSSSNPTSVQMSLIQSRYILSPVIKSLGLDIVIQPKKRFFWSKKPVITPRQLNVSRFELPQKQLNKKFKLIINKSNTVSLYDSTDHLILQGKVGQLLQNSAQNMLIKVAHNQLPVGTMVYLIKQSDTAVVKSLASRLHIEEKGSKLRISTGIISVSLIGSDPYELVRILNKIGQVAQTKDAEKKAQEASKTLEFLYHQLPLTKGLLQKAETKLNEYRAKSGKIDIKLQTKFLLDQLRALDDKYDALNIKNIDMRQRYTPEHPSLIALKAQMNTLKKQQIILGAQIKKLPASDQVAMNLMRDVEVKQRLYMLLLNKIQELQVIKAGIVSNVHILSYATLPDEHLPRKRIIIYLCSIFIGLLLSSLILLLRKAMNPRVSDPQWVERHFDLANMAIIPYCKQQINNNLAIKNNQAQAILLAHDFPRDLSVESLRSLRTSLQVNLLNAKNNVLAILGVTPGVGKSFVSTNLAYLLAAAGKTVLVIDGDLRKGTIHKYFNAKPDCGLADLLNNTATIQQAIKPTSVSENLYFMPRGSYPDNPSELLMSPRFKELIHLCSTQYDIVVIDTPPVLLVTDAVVISAVAGVNYLVLGAGSHQPKEIEIVLKRLLVGEVTVNGTIFNFHRSERMTSNYGMYYGKYGKYGKYSAYYDDTVRT